MLSSKYVAGLFDGEGSFDLRTYQRPDAYKLGVSKTAILAGAYKPTIEALASQFGGQSVAPHKIGQGNQRTLWRWRSQSSDGILQFIDFVLPHLIEKKPQAQMLRDYLNGECFLDVAIAEIRNMKTYSHEHLKAPKKISDQYLAGFFDGEGSVCLYKRIERPGFLPGLAVVNAFLPVVLEYQKHFGGCVSVGRGKNKAIWVWTARSKSSILSFADALLPSLQEKRSQLELLLAYLDGGLESEVAAREIKSIKRVEYKVS